MMFLHLQLATHIAVSVPVKLIAVFQKSQSRIEIPPLLKHEQLVTSKRY